MPDQFDSTPNIKKTILYVDDEKAIGGLISVALSHFGYEIVTATTGEEAISLVGSSSDSFDLIITDMNMHPMNGLDLSKMIKKIAPDMPIIICSGSRVDPKDLSDAGIEESIRKPFKIEKIVSIINRLLAC